MKIDFEYIKQYYPIVELATRLGIEVNSNNTCLCRFHNDNNPSMSFDVRTNRYKCFACNAKGTNIDLVMNILHCDIKTACEFITGFKATSDALNRSNVSNSFNGTSSTSNHFKGTSDTLNHSNASNSFEVNKSSSTKQNIDINVDVDIDYHDIYNELVQNEYTGYNSYLRERGITIAHFEGIECKVILDSKAIESNLIKKYGRQNLLAAGLYSKNNNFLFQDGFLLIPYFDKNNRIHTIKARDTKNKRFANCSGRELILYGINRLYNDFNLMIDKQMVLISHKNIDTVYITESEIDALSFLQVGVVAVACSGSSWNTLYTRELVRIKNIVVATDDDEAGKNLRNKIIESFKNIKPISVIDKSAYKNFKDINDLLRG